MFWIFEILCVAVLGIATLVLARTSENKRLASEYATACVAAWICEHTAIEFYDFYHYDGRWNLFLGHVPLLIALIWPLVLLYAERVASETRTAVGASPLRVASRGPTMRQSATPNSPRMKSGHSAAASAPGGPSGQNRQWPHCRPPVPP